MIVCIYVKKLSTGLWILANLAVQLAPNILALAAISVESFALFVWRSLFARSSLLKQDKFGTKISDIAQIIPIYV